MKSQLRSPLGTSEAEGLTEERPGESEWDMAYRAEKATESKITSNGTDVLRVSCETF